MRRRQSAARSLRKKGGRQMETEVFSASASWTASAVQTETMQAAGFLVGDWMNATRVSQRRGAKFGGRLASFQKNHPAHQPASILYSHQWNRRRFRLLSPATFLSSITLDHVLSRCREKCDLSASFHAFSLSLLQECKIRSPCEDSD